MVPTKGGITLIRRQELLTKLDAALKRMESKGFQNTVHYQRLKAKRDYVANADSVIIYNCAPAAIAAVGALIPNVNFGTKGKHIPARGNIKNAVENAVKWYEELTNETTYEKHKII